MEAGLNRSTSEIEPVQGPAEAVEVDRISHLLRMAEETHQTIVEWSKTSFNEKRRAFLTSRSRSK